MKKTLRTLLIASFLGGSLALAQTGVPSEMSYQAIVTDDNNDLIAPTTAASYEVKVRIFSAATGGEPLWAEQHVTEIFQGRLSITLGQGIDVPIAGGDNEPRPDLADVFTQQDRFIELTVRVNSVGELPKTLAPRQKIAATATALRARVAEVAHSVAENSLPANAIEAGSLDGTIFNNGAVNSTKIGTGIVSNSEFNRLNGVTSPIQTQLNSKASTTALNSGLAGKANLSNPEFTGSVDVIGTSDPTVKIQSNGTNEISGRLSMRQSNDSGFDIYYDGRNTSGAKDALVMRAYTSGSETRSIPEMMIDHFTGNIGIGTVDPVGNLHVFDGDDPTIKIQSDGTDEVSGRLSMRQSNDTGYDIYYDGSSGADQLVFESFNDAGSTGKRMTIKDGNVGIGTTNPSQARLVISGGVDRTLQADLVLYTRHNRNVFNTARFEGTYSIYATETIAAPGLHAFSDARMKSIKGRSDGAEDLALLNEIQITDYTHRDVIREGNKSHKKVIAQQVEGVFPQAVSHTSGVIPDIYQKARIKNNWIGLKADLKVGERVRLITSTEEGVYEVLEIGDGKFRSELNSKDEKDVFVFGREVNDFRAVDYDAISMLNVSATQELYRRLEAKEREVETLNARLEAMEARMIAIEELLPGSESTVKVVSK